MSKFAAKLAVSGGLTIAIKVGAAVFGHWIAWWAAALFSLFVVFAGWWILPDDVTDDDSWFD